MPSPLPTPTALKILRGNPGKRPLNQHEPQPTGPLGDPPKRLPAAAVPYWHEIVAQCAPGVLTSADRWCVELAAVLMQKQCKTRKGLPTPQLAVLRGLLGEMGMNPSSRSRLSVSPRKSDNKFAQLAAEARAQKRG